MLFKFDFIKKIFDNIFFRPNINAISKKIEIDVTQVHASD